MTPEQLAEARRLARAIISTTMWPLMLQAAESDPRLYLSMMTIENLAAWGEPPTEATR